MRYSLTLTEEKSLDFSVREDLNISKEQYEGLWVEIDNTSEKLVCGVLYKHPSSDLEEFANYIYSCLDKLQQHNKTSIILGDFNINLLNC